MTRPSYVETSKAISQSGGKHGTKILAVNDAASILELVTAILVDEGYEVQTAINGRDALEIIERQTFDLFLLDIHMPYMSGFELYEHLQKTFQPLMTNVLFMTGKSNLSKKHVRDFLSKTKSPCITMPSPTPHYRWPPSPPGRCGYTMLDLL